VDVNIQSLQRNKLQHEVMRRCIYLIKVFFYVMLAKYFYYKYGNWGKIPVLEDLYFPSLK
jgi:hypothetical protein